MVARRHVAREGRFKIETWLGCPSAVVIGSGSGGGAGDMQGARWGSAVGTDGVCAWSCNGRGSGKHQMSLTR